MDAVAVQGLSKNFLGRKSLVVHEILSLYGALRAALTQRQVLQRREPPFGYSARSRAARVYASSPTLTGSRCAST